MKNLVVLALILLVNLAKSGVLVVEGKFQNKNILLLLVLCMIKLEPIISEIRQHPNLNFLSTQVKQSFQELATQQLWK